jgi:hypothetical protein
MARSKHVKQSNSQMANSTIQQIHDLLVARVQQLSQIMGETTDPSSADKIVTEMQELVHRIDLSQKLIFTRGSDALTKSIGDINKANRSLQDAINHIQDIAKFLNATTEFLKFVDQALDLAKTLPIV